MKLVCWAPLLVAATLAAFPSCNSVKKNDPAKITVMPSFAVHYATETISPAVVRIDVVIDNFVQGQARPERAIGSGVIIDKEGHILTNFHVAGRAKRIDVTLSTLEHVRAKLIGSDHWTDLALIQLDMNEVHKKNLTFSFAKLGDSSKVTLAEPVMAVGTPYGLSRTVTKGIISNTNRYFQEGSIDQYETGWFNNWLQMDATINPGNSGGPLINLRGEVIGINTRGFQGANALGFAIPINTAKRVIRELLAQGKVTRSYIGTELQPLQDLETFYDLANNKGVLIANVDQSSPASTAGLKAEDILLSVDGTPVSARFPEQLAAVRKLISDYPVGSVLTLEVHRPGQTEPLQLHVTTELLESRVTEETGITAWGLSVRNLTRAYLRERRIPYMKGVLVTGARSGAPGDTAGIQPGDIILKVGDKPVSNTDDLKAQVALWQKKPRLIGVSIRRDRGPMTLVIKPPG